MAHAGLTGTARQVLDPLATVRLVESRLGDDLLAPHVKGAVADGLNRYCSSNRPLAGDNGMPCLSLTSW